MSNTTVAIDGDLSRDTSGNDIIDDDFVSSGSGFSVTTRDIVFGEFTTPGKYNMLIQATDTIGNIATFPITITAYTPIPQIQTVTSSGWISG